MEQEFQLYKTKVPPSDGKSSPSSTSELRSEISEIVESPYFLLAGLAVSNNRYEATTRLLPFDSDVSTTPASYRTLISQGDVGIQRDDEDTMQWLQSMSYPPINVSSTRSIPQPVVLSSDTLPEKSVFRPGYPRNFTIVSPSFPSEDFENPVQRYTESRDPGSEDMRNARSASSAGSLSLQDASFIKECETSPLKSLHFSQDCNMRHNGRAPSPARVERILLQDELHLTKGREVQPSINQTDTDVTVTSLTALKPPGMIERKSQLPNKCTSSTPKAAKIDRSDSRNSRNTRRSTRRTNRQVQQALHRQDPPRGSKRVDLKYPKPKPKPVTIEIANPESLKDKKRDCPANVSLQKTPPKTVLTPRTQRSLKRRKKKFSAELGSSVVHILEAQGKTGRVRKGRISTGCWTCRLRRKKCDGRRPTCLACENLNTRCDGYSETRPSFITDCEASAQRRAQIKSDSKAALRHREKVTAACLEDDRA